MKRLTRIAAALLAVLVLLPAGLARSESVKAYVSSTTLKIYRDYTTSSDVLAVVSFGESFTCTAVKGGWARVESGNAVGYCKVDGLTAVNPNKYSITAYTQGDSTRVYKGAAKDAAYARLDKNTKVEVVAGKDDWCRVSVSGKYGYIKTDELATGKVQSASEVQTGSVSVYVADNTLTVYAEPSTSSNSATIGFGEKMTCVAVSGDWAKVKSGGNVAYCKTGGLTTDNPNTYSVSVYPKSSDVKVRKLPSSSGSVLATVGTGAEMTAIAITNDGDWLRVKGSGEYGYVRTSDVGAKKASSGTKPTSAISAVIALAGDQLGDPYVYAADGPDAFDCSGLTAYCYAKAAGIRLERSAKAQGYDSSYQKIGSISDLKKGDIVCFNTDPDDSDLSDHTGLYIGGGRFIHASSAGGKVMISSLSSGYYKGVFSWGRRIID